MAIKFRPMLFFIILAICIIAILFEDKVIGDREGVLTRIGIGVVYFSILYTSGIIYFRTVAVKAASNRTNFAIWQIGICMLSSVLICFSSSIQWKYGFGLSAVFASIAICLNIGKTFNLWTKSKR